MMNPTFLSQKPFQLHFLLQMLHQPWICHYERLEPYCSSLTMIFAGFIKIPRLVCNLSLIIFSPVQTERVSSLSEINENNGAIFLQSAIK